MFSMIKNNRSFYLPYLLLFFCSITILYIFTKAEIHIYLNKFHSPFFDVFFKYATNFGDGIVLPFFLIILLFIRFREAFLFLLVFLLSGLIVQLLKRTLFHDIVRPVEYFKGIYDLYLVPGVKQYHHNSFPSGHTATAFGYFICFAFLFKKQFPKLIMLFIACLIGYSRVYLSQHFLIDITIGSLIGVIGATVLSYYLKSLKYGWLDLNLRSIISKKENPV